jgi:hypothetical protein
MFFVGVEFYQNKIKFTDNERKVNEENEVLRLKNTALANKLILATKQAEVENKVTKELVEKKSEEYVSKYRSQVKNREENLQVLKEQYKKVQQIYLQRVKDLEESLSKLAEKYTTLEKRRNLEVEGFKGDIRALRKRLENYEASQRVGQSLRGGGDAEEVVERVPFKSKENVHRRSLSGRRDDSSTATQKQKKSFKSKASENMITRKERSQRLSRRDEDENDERENLRENSREYDESMSSEASLNVSALDDLKVLFQIPFTSNDKPFTTI